MKGKFIFFFVMLISGASAQTGFGLGTPDSFSRDRADRAYLSCLDTLSTENISRAGSHDALQYAYRVLRLAQQGNDPNDEATALMHIGSIYSRRGNYHKALTHFYRSLRIREMLRDRKELVKLYKETAITFANLKLYPQALKCYYKMLYLEGRNHSQYLQADIAQADHPDAGLAADSRAGILNIYSQDTALTDHLLSIKNSPPIRDSDLIGPFDDGKTAVAYGLMIHVQQPVPGRRLRFTRITQVGHTFVTLVKFNADSSTVSRSFGFYPKKESPFAATPLHPGSNSIFKNDTHHDWNEVVGKFISRKQFDHILQEVRVYKSRKYNLSTNNCTDFGLHVAGIAGISVSGTKGSWPLGKGNNPGDMGQSILEGKVLNADINDSTMLYIQTQIDKK